MEVLFDEVACGTGDADNVAIATRLLEAGAIVRPGGYRIDHTILEGHRFARTPIQAGAPLLSWGLPFGIADRVISPGENVCNRMVLKALRQRGLDATLPPRENFVNQSQRFLFDERTIQPGIQVGRHTKNRVFEGFDRGCRGVGTRNYILILGASSLAASFVRMLADRFKDAPRDYPNVDGVVAIDHTEGGEPEPNNRQLVLRTLAGFVVHPNVAAVLFVDQSDEAVNNTALLAYINHLRLPLHDVQHDSLSLSTQTSLNSALQRGQTIVRRWLDPVNRWSRSSQSCAHLNLALQCGGSDAFSGVSANPLAGWVSAELLRYGGSAVLAETDELIGAESYILQNVRDRRTARSFVDTLERFKERASWHGHDAEANPSGGNLLRGLYNIALKSIGAARKKDPRVRLDFVIDYGQCMEETGFYFMDSPGNDLESVAGQVASGANLILFTTGNGSITNFPFVPTIKMVSTTGRFELVHRDMDVNAGCYLDGVPMDELGARTFDLALRIASGQRSVGERAGHYQVQVWRNWQQTYRFVPETQIESTPPDGRPIEIRLAKYPLLENAFTAYRTRQGFACDQIGLVVPTSLCSGQIGRLVAERLNQSNFDRTKVNRFVSFAHTEGCGVSGGDNEQLYLRTLVGHATHPLVRFGLFLEHGCEKTHNSVMRMLLNQTGFEAECFGWASIQLDGGIEAAVAKVVGWFAQQLDSSAVMETEHADLSHLSIGLMSFSEVSDSVADALANLTSMVVTAGGVVVVPTNSTLLGSASFLSALRITSGVNPSLGYSQRVEQAGFHVMDTPTGNAVETLAGLGGTGVQVMLAYVQKSPLQAHPLIPLIQCSSVGDLNDMDVVLDLKTADSSRIADELLGVVLRVASRHYRPKLLEQGFTDFQVTRGLLGVSL